MKLVKIAIFIAVGAAFLAAVGEYNAHKATPAQLEQARAKIIKQPEVQK